jgi:Flp pilus assembly protein TadB
MELVLGFLFEFLFEVVFAAIFGATGYKLSTGRRFWMWLAGIALILIAIWWRGPSSLAAWVIAVTGLGVLIWLDSRMRHRPEAASATTSGK